MQGCVGSVKGVRALVCLLAASRVCAQGCVCRQHQGCECRGVFVGSIKGVSAGVCLLAASRV